jgi:hypothetical protein
MCSRAGSYSKDLKFGTEYSIMGSTYQADMRLEIVLKHGILDTGPAIPDIDSEDCELVHTIKYRPDTREIIYERNPDLR